MLLVMELFLSIFTIVTTYYIINWCTNATYMEKSDTWMFRGHHVKGSQIKLTHALAGMICLDLYVFPQGRS
jgi:hypothetical protein